MIGLAVRTLGDLERAGARRARHFMVATPRRAVAGIAVRLRSSAARSAALSPATLAWSLPLTLGYLVAIPFAVVTASEDVAELPRAPRAVRHPGGARAAGRDPRPAGLSVALAPGTAAAVRRSLEIYYRDPVRDRAMDALYARFVEAGDLAFDIGAHVGDRIASFRRLGARVVALEPQPGPARAIRLIHGRDPAVIAAASRRRCDGGRR